MNKPDEIVMRPFDVHIPPIQTVRIEIPVRIENGLEIMTPEAHEMIDKIKAQHFKLKAVVKPERWWHLDLNSTTVVMGWSVCFLLFQSYGCAITFALFGVISVLNDITKAIKEKK